MLAIIVLLGLLAAVGCASTANPDGWARPEVFNDVMYVTLERGELTAVSTESFQKIWTFPAEDEFSCGGGEVKKIERDGIYGEPAIDDTHVYFATYDGAVYAVKQSDGTCDWRIETDDVLMAAPIVDSGWVYVAGTDGYIRQLDHENGNEKTKFNTGEVWATPLLTDDFLYVATMTGRLWKLNLEDLEPVWSAPFKVSAALLTPPTLVGDDTIVVGGIGKKLYGVDMETGEQEWSAPGSNWFWGEPFVEGTNVYAADLNGEVHAIDGTNGDSLWDSPFKAEDTIRSGPVIAGDALVTVDNSGAVYRIDPETGDAIGQPNLLGETVHATPLVLTVVGDNATGTASGSPTATRASGNVPVITAQVVYIVTKDGNVYELDPEAGRTQRVVSR